jgi:hypothetical protein
MDEWGRRKIDGLLEDGTKIIIAVAYVTVTVADSVGLSDAVLCNKTFAVSDSVGLTEYVYGHKGLMLSDSVTLLDAAQIPSKILKVLDSIGLGDAAKVDKALIVSDQIALVEAVYAGKVKRAKLFLIIGNMVMDLTTGEVNFAVG